MICYTTLPKIRRHLFHDKPFREDVLYQYDRRHIPLEAILDNFGLSMAVNALAITKFHRNVALFPIFCARPLVPYTEHSIFAACLNLAELCAMGRIQQANVNIVKMAAERIAPCSVRNAAEHIIYRVAQVVNPYHPSTYEHILDTLLDIMHVLTRSSTDPKRLVCTPVDIGARHEALFRQMFCTDGRQHYAYKY